MASLLLLAAAAALAVLVVVVLLGVWHFIVLPLLHAHHYRSQGLVIAPFFPVLGNLPEFIRMRDSLPDAFYKTFEVWRERYGPNYVFFFGSEVRVVLDEPDVRSVTGWRWTRDARCPVINACR